jgi:ribosomal protein S21
VIEVRKKKGESFESMIRRFNKRVQQSGRIYEARDIRFFSAPKSKNKQRQDALRRAQIRDTKEYERKIGKLKDEYDNKKMYR